MDKSRVKEGILFAAGAIVLFVAIALITFFLLSSFKVNQDTFDAAAASPVQTVDRYAADSRSYWSEYTLKNNQEAYLGYLREDSGTVFEFEVADFVVFEARENIKETNDVFEQASRWFEGNKFKQVAKTNTFVTYENDTNQCQIVIAQEAKDAYGMGCRTRESMKDEVSNANLLIDLYAKSEGAQSVPKVNSRIIVNFFDTPDEGIRYATISFSQASSTEGGLPRLVFGSLSGSWELVANLNNQSVQHDGKRAVSDADLMKLRDEKWKGYLSDVF